MNNNKLDEAALLGACRGVFSKTSYITIGSKEKPEDYVKKGHLRSVFTGKHFSTAPPKDGRTTDVYFEKKHNWVSDGDKYVDKIRYKEVQPEKKRGFLTSDFSKRDEFSNTIRTEQWREQLTTEGKFAKKAMDLLTTNMGIQQTLTAEQPHSEEPEAFLYDAVFEKEDPGFKGASKTHRDTKNRTALSKDRSMGARMTSNLLSFPPHDEFHKPEHARRPLVRDTFYRRTNIFFPVGCAASTGTD